MPASPVLRLTLWSDLGAEERLYWEASLRAAITQTVNGSLTVPVVEVARPRYTADRGRLEITIPVDDRESRANALLWRQALLERLRQVHCAPFLVLFTVDEWGMEHLATDGAPLTAGAAIDLLVPRATDAVWSRLYQVGRKALRGAAGRITKGIQQGTLTLACADGLMQAKADDRGWCALTALALPPLRREARHWASILASESPELATYARGWLSTPRPPTPRRR